MMEISRQNSIEVKKELARIFRSRAVSLRPNACAIRTLVAIPRPIRNEGINIMIGREADTAATAV
jgi:hypothetical protein